MQVQSLTSSLPTSGAIPFLHILAKQGMSPNPNENKVD